MTAKKISPIIDLIHHAAGRGLTPDLLSISGMLDGGEKIEGWDDKGFTPLIAAAACDFPKVAVLLIARGADVHAKTALSETAMHHAAKNGNLETLRILQAAGADMHAMQIHAYTPLMTAATQGRVQVMEYLLAQGVDIDHLNINPKQTTIFGNHHGCSALHLAASAGQVESVRWLVDHGADVLLRSKDSKRTALDYTRECKDPAVRAKITDILKRKMPGESIKLDRDTPSLPRIVIRKKRSPQP